MNNKLKQKFPCFTDIETAAEKKLPKFVWDYLYCGMGHGGSVKRNRHDLDKIFLEPDYLVDTDDIDLETNLLGQTYSAPFGVAPVGLGGVAWPHSAEIIADRANKDRIPFCASTFAMASLETLKHHAGEYGWFQLYLPNTESIEDDILNRAQVAGYENLIITVDVPHSMRRDHDIRNGFNIPVQINYRNLKQIALHPHWALAMLKSGYPTFQNLTRYIPNALSKNAGLEYLENLTVGHITKDTLQRIRDKWRGNLIIKGILDTEDAILSQSIGVDAILVSNHGGRQLESAPSVCAALPNIRKAVGKGFTLLADGGVQSGLDVCRLLSLGADFVLLGRAYYYSVAAMGKEGPAQLNHVLQEEMRITLSQLGKPSPNWNSNQLPT